MTDHEALFSRDFNAPFHFAYQLAPVPNQDGTREDWVRYHAAQALAAWTVFDREIKQLIDHPTVGGRPEIGWISALAVTATHAALAIGTDRITAGRLWEITPEAGALNGEWEEWLTTKLDDLGINPADIDDQYVAADFRSPSRRAEVAR